MDLTNAFTTESLHSVAQAGKFAYENSQSEVSTIHLLYTLFGSHRIVKVCNVLGYDITHDRSQIFELVSSGKTMQDKDLLPISVDLEITLYLAFLISEEFERSVTQADLLLACLHSLEIERNGLNMLTQKRDLEEKLTREFGGMVKVTNPIKSKKSDQESDEKSSFLAKYSKDLNVEVNQNQSLLYERKDILDQVIDILTRQDKSNVMLIGDTGVGKKSIIHLLAKHIHESTVPQALLSSKVISLDVSLLANSLQSLNRSDLLTERLAEELHALGKPIVVIDQIGGLMDSQKSQTTFNFLNIFLSYMHRSNVKIIATASVESFEKNLKDNSSISSGFEKVLVSHTSEEETLQILRLRKSDIEKHYKVQISGEVFGEVVKLASRYIKDSFLPAKAVNLLDQVASSTRNVKKTMITVEEVRQIIAKKTGIPIAKLSESEREKFSRLEETLNKTVKGQQSATHGVSKIMIRSRAGLKDPKKPIGSFLFLGPSGVGKTYLAKTLARQIYDSEESMVRIDMSEFGESHTVQRLIGAPPGYVGYEEGGQLTNPIWLRPYSLILLDEIEKAHPKVFDIFLQVLDEGHLTDGKGRTVDFKHTVIIMTSNIGSNQIIDHFGTLENRVSADSFKENIMMPLLRNQFRVEFLNRFDDIIIFEPLTKVMLKDIALLEIKKIQEKVSPQQITVTVSENTLTEFINNSYNPSLGARPLIRLLQEKIEDGIAQKIITNNIKPGEQVLF